MVKVVTWTFKMSDLRALLAKIQTEIPSCMNLSITLQEGCIIFRQTSERTEADYKASIIFGCIWAILVPLVLYDKRDTLPYLWIVSVFASLYYCHGLLFRGSLPTGEVRYFDISLADKTIRVPRPTPYYVKSQEAINLREIKKFVVEDLPDNQGTLYALLASGKVPVLQDPRYSQADLKSIEGWLVALCGRLGAQS